MIISAFKITPQKKSDRILQKKNLLKYSMGLIIIMILLLPIINHGKNYINVNSAPENRLDKYESNISELIQVYPNPNKGNFTVQIDGLKTETFSLIIYNSMGKIVYERSNVYTDYNDQIYINLTDIQQGVYYLKIHSADFDKITRFIVQN